MFRNITWSYRKHFHYLELCQRWTFSSSRFFFFLDNRVSFTPCVITENCNMRNRVWLLLSNNFWNWPRKRVLYLLQRLVAFQLLFCNWDSNSFLITKKMIWTINIFVNLIKKMCRITLAASFLFLFNKHS